MLSIGIQFFGGRGGGGSGGARGGGRAGGGESQSGAAKVSSDLRAAMAESPGMREYAMTQVLDNAPIGTKIYDGSQTLNRRNIESGWQNEPTYYEKTSTYGWTLMGDTDYYGSSTSNKVAKDLNRKSRNPAFNLMVTS